MQNSIIPLSRGKKEKPLNILIAGNRVRESKTKLLNALFNFRLVNTTTTDFGTVADRIAKVRKKVWLDLS